MSLRVAKQKPANVLSVAIVTRDPARREELAQVVAHAGHAIVDTSSADVVLVDGDPTMDVAILQDAKRLRVIMKDGEMFKGP